MFWILIAGSMVLGLAVYRCCGWIAQIPKQNEDFGWIP